MDKKTFIIFTIALIIVLSCGFSIRARGESKKLNDISNEYYKAIEQSYVDEVRTKLNDRGFANAGISLTKVVDESGAFEYTVSIHHRRIDRMDEYQREELSDIITVDKVAVEGSSVKVKYIMY